jgi:hypothetical protein
MKTLSFDRFMTGSAWAVFIEGMTQTASNQSDLKDLSLA